MNPKTPPGFQKYPTYGRSVNYVVVVLFWANPLPPCDYVIYVPSKIKRATTVKTTTRNSRNNKDHAHAITDSSAFRYLWQVNGKSGFLSRSVERSKPRQGSAKNFLRSI